MIWESKCKEGKKKMATPENIRKLQGTHRQRSSLIDLTCLNPQIVSAVSILLVSKVLISLDKG